MLVFGDADGAPRALLYLLYAADPWLGDADAAAGLGCSPRSVPVYRRWLAAHGLLVRTRRRGRWHSLVRPPRGCRYVLVPGRVVARLLGRADAADLLRVWCALVNDRFENGPGARCGHTTAQLGARLGGVGPRKVARLLAALHALDLLAYAGAPGRHRLLQPLLAVPNRQRIPAVVAACAAARYRAAGLRPPGAPARPVPPRRKPPVPPHRKPPLGAGVFPQVSGPPRVGVRAARALDATTSSGGCAAGPPAQRPPPPWMAAMLARQVGAPSAAVP